MKKEVIVRLHPSFEELVQHEDQGGEYWLARDLQELLGYAKWENFDGVLRRAEQLVVNAAAKGTLVKCERVVAIGSGATRKILDWRLDRDAVELLGLLATSFKLNGYFLSRNETVLLSLLSKWARGKGLTAQAQFRLGRHVFDLMIADAILVEFDEPHHSSLRQSKVDQVKGLTADLGQFKLLRLDLTADVVDAILAIESLIGSGATGAVASATQVVQSARLLAKAKDFANEITNFNIERDGLADEPAISHEHVKNNRDVRDLLGKRRIRPEALPAAGDIK